MKINVTRSSLPDFNTYVERIKTLWDTRHLTNIGKFHLELEQNLSKYLSVDNTLLYTNGHIALEYALDVIKSKGEIITTPFTFASTTQAIIRTGNKPVFCDIKDDFTIDENKIEALITDKTVAIVPVHVYGNICNVDKIDEIAKKHGLMVIYDAAHVFGVKYKDIGIGNYGDLSMFSFHATKVFHTIEGGCLTFSNQKIKDQLVAQRNFGQVSPEEVNYVGGNGKMDEFRSAMGICMLEIVDKEISKRQFVYNRYQENLEGISGIITNKIQDDVVSNYAYFPIVVDGYSMNRDQLHSYLFDNGIFSRKYFYPLTSEFEAYTNLFEIQSTPKAKFLSERILCLPMYPDLDLAQVDRICDLIRIGNAKL